MKIKLVFLAILALVSGAFAQAQHPLTVGVLTIAGPRRTLANNITALLDLNLSSNPQFVVVERSQLDNVLKEQALGKSGMITPATAAKIGQLTGAKILVTGREFNADSQNNIVVIANIVGVETGRGFSQAVQGSATNLVDLISDLSDKIQRTIAEQSSNLLTGASNTPQASLDEVIQQIRGKPQPSILIQINEDAPDNSRQAAQTELGMIFQKAGFTVVDAKSSKTPVILLTGDAITLNDTQENGLFSSRATIEIKAEQQASGKILALDLQQGTAIDISRQAASDMALKNAADIIAERLLPLLAN